MLSIDSKILSKLNVGRDRIRKVLRDNGLLGIQGRNHKYHSYTGDNGMVLNRKLNTSKNKIKLQNKIINRWNIMPL